MNLEQFLALVVANKLEVAEGLTGSQQIAEVITTLDPHDAEGITAEAFNRGIFDCTKTTWEEGLKQVRQRLGVTSTAVPVIPVKGKKQ